MLVTAPIVLGCAAGALGARAAMVLPVATYPTAGDAQPTMHLAPGQRVVWAGTMRSRFLSMLGMAFVVLGTLLALLTQLWLLVPACLIGLVMLSLATLQVRADHAGLHVKYGLLPWPRSHIATSDIASASVIDVRPMEWGGWGYRGSLKLMKQAAVVHRAGPGIRLDLHGGKVFVVTVDDPETPVALLNAEIARDSQPV